MKSKSNGLSGEGLIRQLINAASNMTVFNLNGIGDRKGIEASFSSAHQELSDYVKDLEDKAVHPNQNRPLWEVE